MHAAVEDIREMHIENLDILFMGAYLDAAGQLTDTRQQAKVRHRVGDILGLTFMALLAGNDEWKDIEDFGFDNIETLKKYLELPAGIPSHDTIERVFGILKPSEVQNALVGILKRIVEMVNEKQGEQYLYRNDQFDVKIQDIVAVDGKETHNTAKRGGASIEESRNLNELNVMSTEWGITLSTTRIDEKTNEIPEFQTVARQMDFRGCIVTADALNTQKETVEAIVESRGDYCLALKANQKNAYTEIREYFADEELLAELRKKADCYRKETEENSYKEICREYYITDDIKWFADRTKWKKLKTIGYEKKTIADKQKNETFIEERYYICSIQPLSELFALTVRRHWHIENCLHWTLDIVFKEDSLRSKDKNATHNLGLIRRFVMFIIKLMKEYYGRSLQRIRKKIGRNFETEIPVIMGVLKTLCDEDLIDKLN